MLLISTAKHCLEELLEVRGHVDGYELGIGLMEHNRRLCGVLRGSIRTIHNLPALMPGEDGFMMEPAVSPEPAAEMVAKMVKRVEGMLESWEVYGVHAGLRGQIKGPTDFTVKGELLPFEKCLENIRVFCDIVRSVVPPGRLAIENIYGADNRSPAVGADEGELRLLSRAAPLLLDLGHLAVNCTYRETTLESLNFKGLRVAELHVSFLHPKIKDFARKNLAAAPMFWDHHPYTSTPVNRQILSVASKLADEVKFIVLEVSGTPREVECTLKKLSFARSQ
ncbi:MAG: hypothetical protein KIH01_07140 [Candidatus Freyarchaeota archaeon]|nr:hypothetical protein [Candidatus Jordarchaeia archaeon]